MKNAIKVLGAALFGVFGLFVLMGATGLITGGTIRFYGDVYSTIGFDRRVINETTADLTLYVTSTGSDSNTCLTAPTACLTIQAAIDKVPESIKHKVIIDVGAGSFAAFVVSGKLLHTWNSAGSATDYQFIIRGAAYSNFTPATGTGSGTSTGGTTSTLEDSGQSWTTNNLRGKLLYVNSEYLIIRTNTATSLEVIGVSGSTMSGKAYVIKDWSTIINTRRAVGYGNYAAAAFYGNKGTRLSNNAISIQDIKFSPGTTSGVNYGVYADSTELNMSYVAADTCHIGFGLYRSNSVSMSNLVTSAPITQGLVLYEVLNTATSTNLFAYSSTTGIYITGGVHTGLQYVYSDSNTTGIVLWYIPEATITGLYANGNSSMGVLVYGNSKLSVASGTLNANLNNIYVESSTVSQLAAVSSNATYYGAVFGIGANVRCTTLTGTANGTYGILARYGSKVFITSGTTVTGSTSDIMINATPYTYATDFDHDADYKSDATDLTVIKRLDTM